MKLDKDIEHFLQKYDAVAEESHQRWARKEIKYQSRWVEDYLTRPTMEIEPCVAVHLPGHKLADIVERDQYLNKLERELDYNQKVVNMLREDERVRDRNPAVQKAYRNYLTLLELARNS